MPESDRRAGILGALTAFFTSVGGVLTSLAAVAGGVVALVALFNGSGNGDEPTGVGQPPPPAAVVTTIAATQAGPTLAEWRSQANDVCAGADLNFELSPAAQSNPVLQVFEVGRQTVTTFRNTTDGLRELTAPPEHAADIAEMISAWERGTDAWEGAITALEQGDQNQYTSGRTRTTTLLANANRLARQLGATTCPERVFGEQ
jgi:hypothetical protein